MVGVCRPLWFLIFGGVMCAASAQSPPVGVNAIAIPGQPAREAFVIAPDGTITKAARQPTVRLYSEVLGKSEKVEEFLARHQLAADDKNLLMLRSLNPKTDLSKGVIQAGSKVEVFSARSQDATPFPNMRYAFDSPNLTHYAFLSQAARARELSNAAASLPAKSFEDSSFAKLHVQTSADVRSAAEILETRSDRLSKLEFSVAQFQLEYASKQVASVNAVAAKGLATREQVLLASEGAKAARETAERVQSGKPALDMRMLEVNVFKGNSSEHVRPLQVYVIPSGALNSPQLWTSAQLQGFFTDFSFANDASPVSQAIAANFDPRVCIGPKNAVKGMAELVAARKLSTCRKPELTASKAVLTFRSPDDTARP
jgi:hypothetical protein